MRREYRSDRNLAERRSGIPRQKFPTLSSAAASRETTQAAQDVLGPIFPPAAAACGDWSRRDWSIQNMPRTPSSPGTHGASPCATQFPAPAASAQATSLAAHSGAPTRDAQSATAAILPPTRKSPAQTAPPALVPESRPVNAHPAAADYLSPARRNAPSVPPTAPAGRRLSTTL